MTTFVIKRTSDPFSQPVKEAKKSLIAYKNQVSTNSQKVKEECWVIEISTLEQLQELENKVGPLIITWKESWYDIPKIEIYDDYRE